MRSMYDSVVASNIPSDAQMVAGYVDPDGMYTWTDADWARFSKSTIRVRIAGHPNTNDGHVLDVEKGDAEPQDAPGWVKMRRNAGMHPSVYCSLAVWDDVKYQFSVQGVALPEWWIAAYPGNGPNLYDGSVAHQYQDVGPYDISVVADYWPGVDEQPVPAPIQPTEDDVLSIVWTGIAYHVWVNNGKVLYRAYKQGGPQQIITVPGSYTVDEGQRPLVATAYGTTVLYYASTDGREVVVSPSAVGLIATVQ